MEWIKTEDKRPEKSGAVICFFNCLGNTATSVEWYSMSQDTFLTIEENGNVLNTPTHWMALPDAPK